MLLTVQTMSGARHNFNLEPHHTIEYIKQELEKKIGIKPVQQRLVYAGKILKDVDTIEEANLEAKSVLKLIVQLKGGRF